MATAIREPDWLDALIDEKLPAIEAEQAALAQLEQAAELARGGWPAYGRTVHPVTGFVAENVPLYVSKRSGKVWAPRSEEEYRAILTDRPRYVLLRGGEGSGKSAGAVVKVLERLRRSMEGLFVSPDFEHFKTSAWPLFREWCPSEVVDKSDRHMMEETWEASRKFELHLRSQAGKTVTLRCMGIDDPGSVRGGNVHFACFDEASRHSDAKAFKFLAGRIRLLGSEGEPPQLWLSTTPEMNWLYEYFGPLKTDEPDPFEYFKSRSFQVVLDTADNLPNLDPEYVEERSSVLTAAEERVYMKGEWEDLSGGARFLEDIGWWDACRDDIRPPSAHEPLVCAMDAAYAIGGDTFGFGAVSAHPLKDGLLSIRHAFAWQAKDKKLDFDEIEEDIRNFCKSHNVLKLVYDPTQLHQMAGRLAKPGLMQDGTWFPGVLTEEFSQNNLRNVADKGFLDLIQQRRVTWSKHMTGGSREMSGAALLRKHVDNANRKITEDRKIRIVKRTSGGKIDCAVCASMACHAATAVFNVPQRVGLMYAGGVKIRLAG